MPTQIAESVSRQRVPATFDESWSVGAVFGGAIAAEVVRAARTALDDPAAVPLSLSISYHRPLLPGRCAIDITTAHRGSRIATVTATVDPGGRPAATAQVVLGTGIAIDVLPAREPLLLPMPAESGAGDLSAVVDWRALTDPWGASVDIPPLTAWIRPRDGWRMPDGALDPAWFAVAADLIGPALPAAERAEPFRVATVSLDVRVHATTASEWLRQTVVARRTGGLAVATVELTDPAGVVVATAAQHAMLLPAGVEQLPASVTAFGWGIPNSSIHTQMIGMS